MVALGALEDPGKFHNTAVALKHDLARLTRAAECQHNGRGCSYHERGGSVAEARLFLYALNTVQIVWSTPGRAILL